jgi:hypothetical protein
MVSHFELQVKEKTTNPRHLTSSDLLIWGLVLHLIADWPFQNDWMANNKMKRRTRRLRRGNGITSPPRRYRPPAPWWDRHFAAYVHAIIHGVALALIFEWVAVPLAFVHLLIDTRVPVVKWSQWVGQTQPKGPEYDIGTEVRIWTDQVFHVTCIAIAAVLVTL